MASTTTIISTTISATLMHPTTTKPSPWPVDCHRDSSGSKGLRHEMSWAPGVQTTVYTVVWTLGIYICLFVFILLYIFYFISGSINDLLKKEHWQMKVKAVKKTRQEAGAWDTDAIWAHWYLYFFLLYWFLLADVLPITTTGSPHYSMTRAQTTDYTVVCDLGMFFIILPTNPFFFS